ncbi:MAG: hypothetical protein R6V57_15190 [Vicinamibacterales bacterium]
MRGSRRFCPGAITAIAAVALVVASACAGPRAPGFAATFESPEALAAAVLEGVERRDAVRLRELALSEHEFRKWVWPRLPAGRPEVNMPFDYFWKDLSLKSEASLASTVAEFGGRRLTLRRIEFGGETSDYGPFKVSREARLTVADSQGLERRIQVCGSMIEAGGRWKVFSYVVD